MAVSGQRSAVRKIDHKLTVYGTEDNCLNGDLWDLWDFRDCGVVRIADYTDYADYADYRMGDDEGFPLAPAGRHLCSMREVRRKQVPQRGGICKDLISGQRSER